MKQNQAKLEKLKEVFLQPKQDVNSIQVRLEPFDSPKWEAYKSAGIGEYAKMWAQKLLENEDGAFEECCENISHQMSYYPAIYLVFPYLVEKLAQDLEKLDTEQQIMYISMLGTALTTDCNINKRGNCELQIPDGEMLENYQLSIQKFQLIIKQFLSKKLKSIGRFDSMTKTMLALAVLAVFGNREDAYLFLNSEMDECIYMACDGCEFCDEEMELSSKKSLSAITPREQAADNWDGRDFADTYLWFGDFAELVKAKSLAKHLPYYFGAFQCPECGKEAAVKDFMKNYMSE